MGDASQLRVGRLDEVVPLYQWALADRERFLGAEHRQALASRNNLAIAYESAGRLDDSISLYERTLADRKRILGINHQDTVAAGVNFERALRMAEPP